MEKILEQLRQNGFRITKPRKAVLRLLFDHRDGNLEAKEIQEELAKQGLQIDIATIYRILEMLFEQRIVHKSNFSQQHAHFGLKKPFEVHVICRKCGNITDLELEINAKLRQEHIQQMVGNFKAEDISVEIFGLCDKCKD